MPVEGVLPYIVYIGMRGDKGCVWFFSPFWSGIGYRFNHLGLKLNRVMLCALYGTGSGIGCVLQH